MRTLMTYEQSNPCETPVQGACQDLRSLDIITDSGEAAKREKLTMRLPHASLIYLAAAGSLLTGCHRDLRPAGTDEVAAEVRRDALALVSDYNSGNVGAAAARDAHDYVSVFTGRRTRLGRRLILRP